jgi:hypothetical protein
MKTLWRKNQENSSDRISHAWAPLKSKSAEIETGMVEKSSSGIRQTDDKNLVWFREIERKLAKLSMPTFTYHSTS